jgi:uncharacterized protein (TIGR03437 family)
VIASISPATLPRTNEAVDITITGTGFAANSQVFISGTQLIVRSANPTSIVATIPTGLLNTGVSPLQITVRTGTVSSAAFPVPVGEPAPVIMQLVNAASGDFAGFVSPGELATIRASNLPPAASPLLGAADAAGAFPTELGGVRVLVNGSPAAVLAVTSDQVNFAVPYRIAGQSQVQVAVEARGQLSPGVSATVSATTPGIFTRTGQGTGLAAAVNEDGLTNTPENPAATGSIILLYASGLGTVTPQPADGRITPADSQPRLDAPVEVRIGNVLAEVLYAGPAAGHIAGLTQLTVRAPAGVTGDNVPVTVAAGGQVSRPGVSIAIR